MSPDSPTIEVSANALMASAPKNMFGGSPTNLVSASPFKGSAVIPRKMIWTASSVKQFRQCPRKFFWKYMMRLRQRFPGSALKVGTAFHACLAKWYTSKSNSMEKLIVPVLKDLHQYISKNADFYDDDEKQKLMVGVSSFKGMMLGYSRVNKSDREKWTFDRHVGVEREFLIDCGDFYYAGSIDGLPIVKKKPWVLEHKTASNISEGYVGRLALDTQSRGYMFAVKALTGKLPVGTIYNVTQKCKLRRKADESWDSFNKRVTDDYLSDPAKYFYREELRFTEKDIAAFCLELVQTHKQYMLMANSVDPTNPRSWPIDDAQCNAWFKMCEYHGPCTIGLDMGTSMALEQVEKLHMELGNGEEV